MANSHLQDRLLQAMINIIKQYLTKGQLQLAIVVSKQVVEVMAFMVIGYLDNCNVRVKVVVIATVRIKVVLLGQGIESQLYRLCNNFSYGSILGRG